MATVEDFKVRVNVDGAERLDRVAAGIDSLRSKINLLTSGILGLGFGNLIMGALEAADRISDLADATGLSIGYIKGFENALVSAGGKAQNAEKIITGFYQAIETANDGSLKARDAFAAVGVSLQDLRSLNEKDLLSKTIAGLQQMKEGSERTAIATTLLTKAFRGVDPAQFNIDPTKYAELEASIKRAADANQFLEETYKTLQIGAVEAIRPILGLMEDKKLSVETATKLVTALGVALGVAFSAGLIAQVVALNSALLNTAVVSNLIGKNPLIKVLASVALLAVEGAAGWGAYEAALAAVEEQQKKLTESQKEGNKATKEGNDAATKGSANRTQMLDPRQKAIMESQKRIEQSNAEARLQLEKSTSNDIFNIRQQAAADIAKAEAEINSREYLSKAQKEAEFAAKKVEINAKAEAEIAKIRYENEKRVNQMVQDLRLQNIQKSEALKIEQQILGMGSLQADNLKRQLELDNQRDKALMEIRRMTNMSDAERLEAQKRINIEYNDGIELLAKELDYRERLQNSMSAGAVDAITRIKDSITPFKVAGQMVDSVFNNMTSALDRFVETGKFSFKSFAYSVIQDLIKIQLRAEMMKLLGVGSGGGGGIFGAIGGLFKANGGPVYSNQPYIVGEKGPEMFVPSTAGTIIPNNQMGGGTGVGGTMVTYNINAVDAMSFKQMIAQDPSFLYAVTQQGAKSIPSTRR